MTNTRLLCWCVCVCGDTLGLQAMRLEYAFFAAHSLRGTAEEDRPTTLAQASPAVADGAIQQVADGADSARVAGVHERVALLCVDFDDTLTDGDTTSLLVKAAQEQVTNTACCY